MLGLVIDWLWGAPESFLSFLAVMLFFSVRRLLPVIALGWCTLVGYWVWTGDARRRRFLSAWYGSIALTLVSSCLLLTVSNVAVVLLLLVDILVITLILPFGYWR